MWPFVFLIACHTKTISHFIYMLLSPVTWNSDEPQTAQLLPWQYVCRLSGDWYSLP